MQGKGKEKALMKSDSEEARRRSNISLKINYKTVGKNKYIRKMCKFYNDLQLKIVEDLYINKDYFLFFFTNSFYILYLVSNSVKCILCIMTYKTMYVLCIIVCTKWIIGSVPLHKCKVY